MTCTIISSMNEKLWECKNEDELPYIAVKLIILENIRNLFCKGYTDFYINCEYGIPLWTAEVICALKLYHNIRLHLLLPYEEQCKNWYREHRERYYSVHEKADTIEFASLQYVSGCYRASEMLMIDKSDAILVFAPSNEKLFSAAYAESSGKKVFYASAV